ncbi:MAG TPA: hypothetical protein VFI46_04095 [Jiangellaceae bacterium]|nr:hypothetical protein [Jiangellaceae bacterium]
MAARDEYDPDTVVYQVPTAVALRGIGVGTVVLGLCVIGASILRAAQPPRAVIVGVGIVLGLLGMLSLVVLVVGLLRLVGRGARVVLDADGFLNATGPGAGVRHGRWRDVRRVQSDGPVISIELAGGQRSLVRTATLDVGPRELAQELRRHLTRGRSEPRLPG